MTKNTDKIFNFQNTYIDLNSHFFQKLDLLPATKPEMVLLNEDLAKELGINLNSSDHLLQVLSGSKLELNSEPIAQAYAGHQFGYFTMLGDGRTALLGEHLDAKNQRFDIQLKGSGRTAFSRRGDGKATLKAMLREYLVSETMHHLGVPTSRSLAVVKTGETVYRERSEEGAILTRVMSSHLRVGTFEFARYYLQDELENLLNYTIRRHFPRLEEAENKALALLEKVMEVQIDLVLNWERIGFIHGVMNTDNTSIVGETFDYGPCAFMEVYDPSTVYSSIDTKGRYSFGNQGAIIKWNLARFAESLLPLIDFNEDQAIGMASKILNQFDDIYNYNRMEMLMMKLGIDVPQEGDQQLVKDFLNLLYASKKEYNHSFTYLRLPDLYKNTSFELGEEFDEWKSRWENRISIGEGRGRALSIMEKVNPVFVPTNFHVEEALEEGIRGDLSQLNELLENIKYPYTYRDEMKHLMFSPKGFDDNFQTYCGT